ncbi:MAG TPA: class I SAM-dependent methyltransferase [Bacteriovoracaceae bacterium]|nr:class I SAM-dependent methyltransferase [Bacteriovoracaceae bacterium]
MSTSFKPISCTACQKGSYLFRYVDNYRLNRCPSCGVIHLDRVHTVTTNFLNDVKTKPETSLEYWGYPEYFRKYKTVFDYFFEDRFDKIMKGRPERRDWFDLGAGFGLWMDFLKKEKRIVPSGVEIEENATQYAKSLGLEVIQGDFLRLELPRKYQVITMCDVLEHLENPLEALKKCHHSLSDGGLLYIQVPNVVGLKYPYNDHLGLPHHLWQFDPKSLFYLINRAGFEMIDYWTGVQGVIGHYEKGTATFTRKLMWKLASELKRGNRLQMLVRKK